MREDEKIVMRKSMSVFMKVKFYLAYQRASIDSLMKPLVSSTAKLRLSFQVFPRSFEVSDNNFKELMNCMSND